jgi:hypothetical protein
LVELTTSISGPKSVKKLDEGRAVERAGFRLYRERAEVLNKPMSRIATTWPLPVTRRTQREK